MNLNRWFACGVAAGSFALLAPVQSLAQSQPQQAQPPQQPADGAPAQPAPRDGQPREGRPREGGPREAGPGNFGMGGRQLSPERAKAAWALQASGVAGRLGLNADQAKALAGAYAAARESQSTAADTMRQDAMQRMREEGPNPEMMRDMLRRTDELNAAEREKLNAALATAIGADAAAKAIPSLGLFSRQWDSIVDVFSTFGVEGANQQTALNAIEEFARTNAEAQAKLRAARANQEGGGEGAGMPDREGMRAAAQEGRQKLLDAMKPILNKEQMTKLEESMPGAGRGGPGGRRQGGGGGS